MQRCWWSTRLVLLRWSPKTTSARQHQRHENALRMGRRIRIAITQSATEVLVHRLGRVVLIPPHLLDCIDLLIGEKRRAQQWELRQPQVVLLGGQRCSHEEVGVTLLKQLNQRHLQAGRTMMHAHLGQLDGRVINPGPWTVPFRMSEILERASAMDRPAESQHLCGRVQVRVLE